MINVEFEVLKIKLT